MTASERHRRADAADALCAAAFARALCRQRPHRPDDDTGVALVAVGGFGRRELAPFSDLDVVLVHEESEDVEVLASALWYPLWDAGANVDHAVRSLSDVTQAAQQDLRVVLGLLDARHVAGDPTVTLRLRTSLRARWRREARTWLPELAELVRARVDRLGELAHASVPDLKESGGGLRDATVLEALVATWLVDVPHAELGRARQRLLDVRDALHAVSGRASDRIAPDLWEDLAVRLGHPDAGQTQRTVRETGRRLTHLSRLTWRRVDDVLAPRRAGRRTTGPVVLPLEGGVAESGGEVVVVREHSVRSDPAVLLRAAAVAAERRLVLSPHTVARLRRTLPALPDPWPEQARDLLVRLLGAGPGLLPVWETLEETGALAALLPEWDRVRLLPHASPVHRFTVDRHLVETCIEAAKLIRRVGRPDVLLLAALLHDIGKGGAQDHSVAGAPVAAAVAARVGLDADDVTLVERLVRHHLLLAEVATTRDPTDPATVTRVLERVGDAETFELLLVLTEADARATSAKAWTPWRTALVTELADWVRTTLEEGPGPGSPERVEPALEPVPPEVLRDSTAVDVRLRSCGHGLEVTVVTGDRSGLLAAVSGALGLMRATIRSARAWVQDDYAFSRWQVDHAHVDPALLRSQVRAVLEGRLDPGPRLRRSVVRTPEPSVAVRPEASRQATVIEVRTEDRPGVVHLVCGALADLRLTVRSAHVATLGPQAVDVFYVQEEGAGALGDERAAAAAHAVRRALTDPGYP